MPDSGESRILVHQSLADIPAADWDASAGADNPFVSHDFLLALEESGSATAETGWLGQHLTLEAPDGQTIGVMPLYAKSHSQGEYVFDWGWAEAYENAGGRYYPKLQSSVPFTPVTAPRLMVLGDGDTAGAKRLLAGGAAMLADRLDLSSLHLTFLEGEDAAILKEAGYLLRADQQFHWHNGGYDSFDEFLAALSSRKRKAIRRERKGALKEGEITVEQVTGAEITEDHWDHFFEFYQLTGARKWGSPYLTRQFFSLVGERMADRILLVFARRAGNIIAGALNFIGSDALYGRHWGCSERHRFLHFELCYYQAIDFAIEHGLSRVEAGAQGEHKLARGYLPVKMLSAHYIRDPGFRAAVERFVQEEGRMVDEGIEILRSYTPFRRG